MERFRIRPEIYQFDTFKEFIEDIPLGEKDLLVTQKLIYELFIKDLNLRCHVIFPREFGKGEPSDIMIDGIVNKVKDICYNRVIAAGGGTAIDIAKLLSLKKFDYVEQLFEEPSRVVRDKKLIIIPATCGTGSEVTNISITTLTKKGTKLGIANDELFADKAVLISELISTLPFKFFCFSSIDALVHATEAFLSPKANDYTDIFAQKAISEILKAFKTLMVKGQKERKNVEKKVLVASNYAGIAFGNAGTAVVHALAYPLSGTYHVAHGEANYQFYSEVLKKYYDKNPKGKIKIFVEFVADILECNANVEVFKKIEELFASMVPKKRLREYGMKESEISSFAISIEKEQQRLLVNNYVFLSIEEFKDIYRTLY